jgi:NAD(P)-dependent dehydrogenase (short-subunit alcohol dehydrogenase family)
MLFELNFHAPVDLAVAVLPGMRARGAGWIVNVSSATSHHPHGPPFRRGSEPTATATIYGASKAALERFTTGLAAEVHGDGIAVNAVSPVAAVRTPGADALVAGIMDARPELVEPVELMAEASLVLATCDPATCTGRILLSRPFLEELGRVARNLDGSPRPDGTVA